MSMSTTDDFRHAAKANYKVNARLNRGCSGKYGKTAVFGCWRGGMFRLCTVSSIIAVHTSWVPPVQMMEYGERSNSSSLNRGHSTLQII